MQLNTRTGWFLSQPVLVFGQGILSLLGLLNLFWCDRGATTVYSVHFTAPHLICPVSDEAEH